MRNSRGVSMVTLTFHLALLTLCLLLHYVTTDPDDVELDYISEQSIWQIKPPTFDHLVDLPTRRPLIIGHRGSSGQLPEHTAQAYRAAIQQGADVIECDVTITRDLVLICLHESWMGAVTDVADKFPGRLTTRYIIDKQENITDYFSVDFTLEELKTLKVKQRFDFRDHAYDGLYQICTLQEYIEIAQNANRSVGIYPETKEPSWTNSLDIIVNANTTFEELLVDELASFGYNSSTSPCFLQSFSEESLVSLSQLTPLPSIMLLEEHSGIDDADLDRYAQFAYGIGPSKRMIVEVDERSRLSKLTSLMARAKSRGLRAHAYTFRNEDHYLAWDYLQDPYREYFHFLLLHLDGYFTDFPASLAAYMDGVYTQH